MTIPEGEIAEHYEIFLGLRDQISTNTKNSPRSVKRIRNFRNLGVALLRTELQAEQTLTIKYALAQSFYDQGRYRKAIDMFTALVYEYPDTDEAFDAVKRALDGSKALDGDYGLMKIGHLFLRDFTPISEKIRIHIDPIVQEAEKRVLDQMVAALPPCHCCGCCLCPPGDEIRLPPEFAAAHKSGNAIKAYEIAERFVKEYPDDSLVPAVLATCGQIAAKRFEFDKSLSYYSRAAAENTQQRPQILLSSGKLREELGDSVGAARDYLLAYESAKTSSLRSESVVHLADLYDKQRNISKIAALLRPHKGENDPEILSRLGLAEVRLGRTKLAKIHLSKALKLNARSKAKARAHYGLAEIELARLEQFQPAPTIKGVQEMLDLVELIEDHYLETVRQGESLYTFAAFSRISQAYEIASQKMFQIQLTNVSGQDKKTLEKALKQRAQQIKGQSKEALKACAERVLQLHRYDTSGRSCLAGSPPQHDPAYFEELGPRDGDKISKNTDFEDLRSAIFANPNHAENIEKLGRRLLKAGDFHSARLVFAHAASLDPRPDLLNLLGLAAIQAGDISGGLEAFGQAAEGGHLAAQKNMNDVLKGLGLSRHIKQLKKSGGSQSPNQLLP